METTDLEIVLEGLDEIPEPNPSLEQYSTPPYLASKIIETANLNKDLEDPVIDLGCGSGTLAIAAALIDKKTVGIDIDRDALRTAKKNISKVGISTDIDLIQSDVSKLSLDIDASTVLMNPPFGAQSRGADRAFLDTASNISRVTYSIHNTGSREFVDGYIDGEITHTYVSSIPIPNMFEFHSKETEDIEVEIFRIEF